MGLVVLPALIPDIEKVYDVYFSAFAGEEMAEIILKVLFPGGITPEFRKGHTAATLAYWHTATNQYTMKCVDTSTSTIIGMALGDIFLHRRTPEERANPGIGWLQGEERARAERILNPLHEIREELFKDAKYVYAHVMGVDPKYQKTGGGMALLKWAIETSDNSGLPIYFESSPTTVKLYERVGFVRLKETIVHKAADLQLDHDIEVPLMVRMPKRAQEKGITFEVWREQGYPDL